MRRSAAALLVAMGVIASCSAPMPSPSAAPGTPSAATPTPAPTQAPVSLPADAPLTLSDCGWPSETPIAFAGFATVADLQASQIIQGSPLAHVYALVSRDPVELHPMIGSPMLERGFCALRQDGAQVESGVPSDWAFHGTLLSLQRTCEAGATDCARETMAVLDTVADVGHPAARITFRPDAACIWLPFMSGPHSCFAIIQPEGTERVTNAVVSFAGTDQQDFLNLFWLADGSISTTSNLATPPPGATPIP
jgi:hypothetical protein